MGGGREGNGGEELETSGIGDFVSSLYSAGMKLTGRKKVQDYFLLSLSPSFLSSLLLSPFFFLLSFLPSSPSLLPSFPSDSQSSVHRVTCWWEGSLSARLTMSKGRSVCPIPIQSGNETCLTE